MNGQDFIKEMTSLLETAEQADKKLTSAQNRFCREGVINTGHLARLLTMTEEQKRLAIPAVLQQAVAANDETQQDFQQLIYDLTIIVSDVERLAYAFVDMWNAKANNHAGALTQAQQEAAEIQRRLKAYQERKREHAINSPEIRSKVWAVTDGRCIWCDVELTRERDPSDLQRQFVVDHLVAKANGGPDHLSNYVPSCAKCNGAKATRPWFDFLRRRQPDLKIVGGSEA